MNIDDPQADDADYVTIVTGTQNVTAGTLATFDPTLLLNDDYVIRVIAEDASGNVSAKTVPISLQGELKLGHLHLEFTDLAIPLAGVPIAVTRVYDSLQAAASGDFGFGWSLGTQDGDIRETIPVNPLELQGLFFASTPFREGTRVYLTNPDGKRVGFTFNPKPQFSIFGGGYFVPQFDPDPGVTDKLEVDPTAMKKVNGSFFISFLGFPYNPQSTGSPRIPAGPMNTTSSTD